MKLKSLFIKFVYGRETLEKKNSPVNGEIEVIEDLFRKKEMKIGRVTQSGGLVKKLWQIAFSKISNFRLLRASQISNCLILGLGCGDAAKLINKKWPNAQITGVEIDPKVIEIGKKYFDLDKIPNLEIIVEDALDKKFNTKFDLILIDVYLGTNFPKKAESDQFLTNLKKILTDHGLLVFNRLYYNQRFKQEADIFLKKVKGYFRKVKTKKAITNLLIFASN